MDTVSRQKRSEIMSKVKSKNTKPEILIRKALFAKGLRYRINVKSLPGSPDIVLKKYKTVIFVHGCFWHGHDCKYGKLPATNTEFWKEKRDRNKKRDQRKIEELEVLNWKVFVVWECEINSTIKLSQKISELYTCILEGNKYE